MDIELNRFAISKTSTHGTLNIDGKFNCFTLEDMPRNEKIAGKTCVPAGQYEITFRKETSPMNKRYYDKYGSKFHHGMLMLNDVPDFSWVYIHTGNTHIDTEGCLLVGCLSSVASESIGSSVNAYKALYPVVSKALIDGDKVFITITDNV